METLSFMLGVSLVLIIAGVMFMFSMYKKINHLDEKLTGTITVQNETFRSFWKNNEEIHRRIAQEIDRVDRIKRDIQIDVSERDNQLSKVIDSRLDKLENKLKVRPSKELINE